LTAGAFPESAGESARESRAFRVVLRETRRSGDGDTPGAHNLYNVEFRHQIYEVRYLVATAGKLDGQFVFVGVYYLPWV